MVIWKPVIGYEGIEGIYEVSSEGDVRSIDRMIINAVGSKRVYKGKILSFHYNHKGYRRVQLGKHGAMVVHQIVARAFIPNPDNKPQVNHIDGNKDNNSVSNLEWVTLQENMKHAVDNGLLNTSGFNDYNNSRARKVSQYALDGQFIRSFDSLQETARLTGDYASNIREVCIGKRQKSKGFIYRFV